MNDVQQRTAAKHFAEYWAGKGYEKGESQKFWLSLLTEVFGVEHAAEFISFEDQVHLDHTSFIDGYIPETHVLIEQKGLGKDLKKPIRQSDGTFLKPIQQAQRYASVLPYSKRPRWIIVCNFECFHIYDMEHPQSDPTEIWLKDLPTQYYLLEFMVRQEDKTLQKEMEISIAAGELVGKLYDAFLKEYKDPTNEHSLKSLNALCVRLVFCLYAEDAGIFGKRLMFHDYMTHRGLANARQALIDLFRVLDTKIEDRDPYMDDELAAFPYVNGGLFSDENIEIPRINGTIYDLLLNQASASFDWSEISPTIFGAVFESTLNPETRRSGGMHYTSIENIHKVIDPLFLDGLRQELADIKAMKVISQRDSALLALRRKLGTLKFLDPASGSGNFLTESYLCLRRMENDILRSLSMMWLSYSEEQDALVRVHLDQFYGIEINDFAVSVAKTALWIAEIQMSQETEDIIHAEVDILPLKTYVNIHCGNALRMDWHAVVPREELSYIMGNPPFVGGMMMTPGQKSDMLSVFSDKVKGVGELDYVGAWYRKAADYIKGTHVNAAFVSTNSITQGEQVAILWEKLCTEGLTINFAYRTFQWDSEASIKAHVHVVIIGFSYDDMATKKLFNEPNNVIIARHISPYLIDAPDVFIHNVSKPMCNVPAMSFGNMPRDGGGFVLKEEEAAALIKSEPLSQKWIHLYLGAEEFINAKKRYCLWLDGADPSEIRKCPTVLNRVESVRAFRASSKARSTRMMAQTPTLFAQITQKIGEPFLIVPSVSSEKRRYVPMGFLPGDVISSNAVQVIPDAELYHFGILTSNVHMAWMRTVCGRLKSDYRYSKDIVYNNFPWPTPTDAQKARIEQTAQAILDARALYPDSSLADLYDELTMPPELRKAHQANDRAVMEAYGMPIRETTESSCVAELMRRYQALTVNTP